MNWTKKWDFNDTQRYTTMMFILFKKRLSRIVKEDFIESWLQKPNAAFDNRKPIDLINEDNYQPLYDMIYRLGSGEPLS